LKTTITRTYWFWEKNTSRSIIICAVSIWRSTRKEKRTRNYM